MPTHKNIPRCWRSERRAGRAREGGITLRSCTDAEVLALLAGHALGAAAIAAIATVENIGGGVAENAQAFGVKSGAVVGAGALQRAEVGQAGEGVSAVEFRSLIGAAGFPKFPLSGSRHWGTRAA